MRIISVANQKGGCGKTTVSLNLASALANAGVRTLLIDNDPQGHATAGLGVAGEEFTLSTRDLYLTSDILLRDVVHTVKDHLDLVPAGAELAVVESELTFDPYRAQHLRERLALSHPDHEICIIDNPPHVGVLTFNALLASSEVIVPVDPGRFTFEAVVGIRDTVEMLRVERGHSLRMRLLPNGFDLRTLFDREMLERLSGAYPQTMLSARIRPTVRLREAARRGIAIDEYDARCPAHRDFEALARELCSSALELPEEEVQEWDAMLHGPRPTPRGVVFHVHFPRAQHVSVTGDFADWSVEGHPLEKQSDGSWRVELALEPGVFEYKFIVDGVWKVDPTNPERVRNSYGQLNSVLTVQADTQENRNRRTERGVGR